MEHVTEHTETVAAPHEAKGPSALDLFSIEPGLVLWTWITFFVLFFILRKFAWKPLAQSVEKREKTITDAVENARKTKEALEKISEEQKQVQAKTEQEAQEILRKGREAGEKAARDIEEKARQAADQMVQDAKRQIGQEKGKAIAALKAEAVDMVIQTSTKLVEQSLDDEAHRSIVKRHLEEL